MIKEKIIQIKKDKCINASKLKKKTSKHLTLKIAPKRTKSSPYIYVD